MAWHFLEKWKSVIRQIGRIMLEMCEWKVWFFLFQSMSLCTEQRKKREVSTYAAYQYNGLCNQDCLLFGNKKAQGYNGKMSFWIKDSGELYSQNHKAVKKREDYFSFWRYQWRICPCQKSRKDFFIWCHIMYGINNGNKSLSWKGWILLQKLYGLL